MLRLSRLFVLIFFLLAAALPGFSQGDGGGDPQSGDPRMAALTIRYDARTRNLNGVLFTILRADKNSPDALAQSLSTAFPADVKVQPTDPDDLDEDPLPAGFSSAIISVRKTLARAALVSDTLDLRPLLAELQRREIKELRVSLTLPARNTPTVTSNLSANDRVLDLEAMLSGRRTEPRTRGFRRMFSTSETSESAVVRFSVGWSAVDLWKLLGGPVGLMLLPILVALVYRARAMAALSRLTDPDARRSIGSGCLRLINHGAVLYSPLLLGTLIASRPEQLLEWLFPIARESLPASILRGIFVVSVPITIAQLGALMVLQPVVRRVSGHEEGRWQQTFGAALGQIVSQSVPGICYLIAFVSLLQTPLLLGVLGLFLRRPMNLAAASWDGLFRAIGWGVTGFFLSMVLPAIVSAGGSERVYPLTSGPLLESLTGLANRAKVAVRGAFYIDTGKELTANAFAIRGNIVAVTDHLVRSLTRAEVDAVLAHELGHLKQRHAAWVGWLQSPFLILPILWFVLPRIPGSPQLNWLYIPLLVLGSTLVKLVFSRQWERTADRFAAQLTGNPAALLTGLAKLARVSGLSETWSRWDDSLSSHPGNRRRAENLIRAGLISPGDVEAAFESARQSTETDDPDARYPAPESVADAIFSPQWVLRRGLRQLAIFLFALALLPVGAVALLDRTLPQSLPGRLIVLGVAATLVGVLASRQLFWPALSVNAGTRRQLREKLLADGALTDGDDTGFFVAVNPGRHFRQNPGGAHDFAFVVPTRTHLRVLGEKARFEIPRAALRPIERIESVRTLVNNGSTVFRVRWDESVSGESGERTERASVRLAISGGGSRSDWDARRERFHAALTDWYSQTAPGPDFDAVPFVSELPGQRASAFTRPLTYVKNFVPLFLGLLTVVALTGIDRRLWLILCLPMLVIVVDEWVAFVRLAARETKSGE